MRVRRVESLSDFQALAPVWDALARESGQTSPFLSHAWFACCWHAVDASRQPEILVVEDGAGPVGLVPLVRWAGARRGLTVQYLGPLDAPDTPFTDWLITGRPEPVIEVVMSHLALRRDWDVLALSGLPTSSLTLKALDGWLRGRFRSHTAGVVRSPYLVVTGTWQEFWAARSQRFKKTIRNVRNRLERAGSVTVEEHRELDGRAPAFLEALDVSMRSWKAQEGVAMGNMPRMPEFFRELTERASAQSWLRLWILRLDGRAIATEYQIEDAGRVYALRSDFDGTLPGELSPGAYLNWEIVRALFDLPGVHEYNMGPGENEYKTRWASDAHETARLLVFRPGAYGTALYGLEAGAVPAWRSLSGQRSPA